MAFSPKVENYIRIPFREWEGSVRHPTQEKGKKSITREYIRVATRKDLLMME